MAGQISLIPLPVILAAIDGDENSLATVAAHFRRYTRCLSTRVLNDEYGNTYLYVDEDMCLRLEGKLIYSVVTGFTVLPA